MTFYTVSQKPVETLSEEEVRRETDEIRRELVAIEGRLSEKAAWVKKDGAPNDYFEWLAKTRRFHTLLLVRFTQLKPVLREFNRRKSTPRRSAGERTTTIIKS